MNPKTNEEQQAFNLYFQTNLTQQQIADTLSINRKTLYTWISEGDWKRKRYTARHAPSFLVEQYYEQLANINRAIAARTDNPTPTREEADIMRKISMTIKQVRKLLTPCEVMDLFTDFTMTLSRKKKYEEINKIMPLMNTYVNEVSEYGKGISDAQKFFNELRQDEEYEAWLQQQAMEEQKMNDIKNDPKKATIIALCNPETAEAPVIPSLSRDLARRGADTAEPPVINNLPKRCHPELAEGHSLSRDEPVEGLSSPTGAASAPISDRVKIGSPQQVNNPAKSNTADDITETNNGKTTQLKKENGVTDTLATEQITENKNKPRKSPPIRNIRSLRHPK